MKVLKHYESFNGRRYSNPWVAMLDLKTLKPNFSVKVGGYTGFYGKGQEGDLYVIDPKEDVLYMYGQKDYRGNFTEKEYARYLNGEFIPVDSTNLIAVLEELSCQKEEKEGDE